MGASTPQQGATYTPWTREDGKRMIRVQGVHRGLYSDQGDAPHPLEGQPYWYDRADYSHEAIAIRPEPVTVEEAEEVVDLKAPRRPAFELPEDHPGVPDKARSVAAKARAAGWSYRFTGAESAQGVLTLVLRARHADGGRVALAWRFTPAHWTKPTKAGIAPRWVVDEWKNEGAWIGRPRAQGGIVPVSHTEAAKELSAHG